MTKKVIGILGGMGPEATCEIFRRIIQLTPARCDQEHVRVIIDNNPQIPDRTRAIFGKEPSPVEEMIATGQNLERAGADFIIIPCITAHYFLQDVQKEIRIPILNGITLINEYLQKHTLEIRKVGLLATSGTIKTQLFQKGLPSSMVITPEEEMQEKVVMDVIYGEKGIKAGNTSMEIVERIVSCIDELKKKGAQGIIAGCTEFGLIMRQEYIDIPLIDPLTLLAERAVAIAKEMEE